MTLYTKCIFLPREESDGERWCVMNRLTLNDGKTPDPRLEGAFDRWVRDLSPPGKLVGMHYRGEVDWSQFTQSYRVHLQAPQPSLMVGTLIAMSLVRDITVLCVEEDHTKCHRGILATRCGELEPRLIIEHRPYHKL